MRKSYDPEFKPRAIWMVLEHREDYRSMAAASKAIGDEFGVSREALRSWARQSDVGAGNAPGVIIDG